jgi:hypothetical protein
VSPLAFAVFVCQSGFSRDLSRNGRSLGTS